MRRRGAALLCAALCGCVTLPIGDAVRTRDEAIQAAIRACHADKDLTGTASRWHVRWRQTYWQVWFGRGDVEDDDYRYIAGVDPVTGKADCALRVE